jgi:23S rRNA pseudouridine955/2504/2580 synthase
MSSSAKSITPKSEPADEDDWDYVDSTPPKAAKFDPMSSNGNLGAGDADADAGSKRPAPARFDGPKVETIQVERDEADMRLDRWFRTKFPDVGQGYLQKLLRSGQVRVDSKRAQANDRLTAGQQIRVPHTVRTPAKRKPSLSTASNLSDDDRYFIENMILFEDDHVLVLNKPFGLAVQGGSGTKRHLDGILAGMIERFGDRPRLVHRLDRDTTGVILVAKTRGAAAKLGRTFQTRSAAKTYWALVSGVPKPHQGRIEAALVKASGPDGDRVRKAEPGEQERAMHATTHYSMIERVGQKMAWVSLKPVTGRQHQLRAHMSIIGHPIVGDNKYQPEKHHGGGIEPGDDGIEQVLHLHARRLMLPHPFDEGRRIDVTAPLPEHMKRTWNMLGLDERRFED